MVSPRLCDTPGLRKERDAIPPEGILALYRTFSGISHFTPMFEGLFLQLLRRYNQEMVSLRIQFLTRPERSAESRTILVRDIPGVYYGSLADRVERTALRFLPAVIKRSIVVRAWLEPAPENVTVRLTLYCMHASKSTCPLRPGVQSGTVESACLDAARSRLSTIFFGTLGCRSSLCHGTIEGSNRLM